MKKFLPSGHRTRVRAGYLFSGIGGKIILANLLGLFVFLFGALSVNFSRQSLTDTRLTGLIEQAEMLAGALTANAEEKRININLLKGANGIFLRPPIVAPEMRALLFNKNGRLIEDSDSHPPGAVKTYRLPDEEPLSTRIKKKISMEWIILASRMSGSEPPLFEEANGVSVHDFPEVKQALAGENSGMVRINSRGEMMMSAAVPVKRLGPILGALHLSVSGNEISEIMREDRRRLLNLFIVAAFTSLVTSYLLARGIARPLKNLSLAARRYELKSFTREGKQANAIPLIDYSGRKDEIGSLSRSLKKMFRGLENRMTEAETFAAEVSHELKNPLTSLKSALDTRKKINDPDKKALLEKIMQHDIRRIDRLIGDISNFSRLDGEMMRETDERFNLTRLLKDLTDYYQNTDLAKDIQIITHFPEEEIFLFGLAERLGQVFRNLLDNAISFTPAGKAITLTLSRDEKQNVIVIVDDEGCGLPLDRAEQIFERFYSHRPGNEKFGSHSGLGLSIAKKITEAHDGKLQALNRLSSAGDIIGARFIIIFPASVISYSEEKSEDVYE